MKTVEQRITELIKDQGEKAAALAREVALLSRLKGLAADWFFELAYRESPGGVITLGLLGENAEQGRELAEQVLRALGAQRANKVFNETTGDMSYIIEKDGLKVEVVGRPTRCKVKVVEDEVVVPASVQKRKRYVIENPEDCYHPNEAAKVDGA